MAKLRHVAVTVPDLESAAQFYEKTFEMSLVPDGGKPMKMFEYRYTRRK